MIDRRIDLNHCFSRNNKEMNPTVQKRHKLVIPRWRLSRPRGL